MNRLFGIDFFTVQLGKRIDLIQNLEFYGIEGWDTSQKSVERLVKEGFWTSLILMLVWIL